MFLCSAFRTADKLLYTIFHKSGNDAGIQVFSGRSVPCPDLPFVYQSLEVALKQHIRTAPSPSGARLG